MFSLNTTPQCIIRLIRKAVDVLIVSLCRMQHRAACWSLKHINLVGEVIIGGTIMFRSWLEMCVGRLPGKGSQITVKSSHFHGSGRTSQKLNTVTCNFRRESVETINCLVQREVTVAKGEVNGKRWETRTSPGTLETLLTLTFKKWVILWIRNAVESRRGCWHD